MRILIVCKANSCRSQMAEAILKNIDANLDVISAGTDPAERVHPLTVQAMHEIGIDISKSQTRDLGQILCEDWDFVITVCDIARETFPAFQGTIKKSIYIKFEDPLGYSGDDEFLLKLIRSTRTHITNEMEDFYNNFLI